MLSEPTQNINLTDPTDSLTGHLKQKKKEISTDGKTDNSTEHARIRVLEPREIAAKHGSILTDMNYPRGDRHSTNDTIDMQDIDEFYNSRDELSERLKNKTVKFADNAKIIKLTRNMIKHISKVQKPSEHVKCKADKTNAEAIKADAEKEGKPSKSASEQLRAASPSILSKPRKIIIMKPRMIRRTIKVAQEAANKKRFPRKNGRGK